MVCASQAIFLSVSWDLQSRQLALRICNPHFDKPGLQIRANTSVICGAQTTAINLLIMNLCFKRLDRLAIFALVKNERKQDNAYTMLCVLCVFLCGLGG